MVRNVPEISGADGDLVPRGAGYGDEAMAKSFYLRKGLECHDMSRRAGKTVASLRDWLQKAFF